MRILVTGAEGFVGGRLVPRLLADGHEAVGAVRRGVDPGLDIETRPFDLRDDQSVREVVRGEFEAVVHLAGIASGADARRDPGRAWEVNAAGTARLCEALAVAAGTPPLLLLASTAEVYGAGAQDRARLEQDPPFPCSPYAASKLAAEIASQEVARRAGLRVIIARAFPHTGAGQSVQFVVTAFARRIAHARAEGIRTVAVGNLDPVRDILHVDDVADAYARLLEAGVPGRVYNVASGRGVSIREVFERLCSLLGASVRPVPDPVLVRTADIAHLVGSAERLRSDTGWQPQHTLDDALTEVARAEAH